MAQDNRVIGYVSQAELSALMRETGMISIQDTANADGKPVIHALLKVVNAQTGAELPGGLPFSVVMFKRVAEAGYSNIAIGTVVPAAELGIDLPADFFNLCNRRFRFVRAFPLDATAFVMQMDLVVRHATAEYVKFAFGLWGSIFSQALFELMGTGRDSLSRAAEIYSRAPVNFAPPVFDAVTDQPVAEPAVETALDDGPQESALPQAEPAEEALPQAAVEAAPVVPEEPVKEDAPAEPAVEPAAEEAPGAQAVADPVEAKPEEAALAEETAEPAFA